MREDMEGHRERINRIREEGRAAARAGQPRETNPYAGAPGYSAAHWNAAYDREAETSAQERGLLADES